MVSASLLVEFSLLYALFPNLFPQPYAALKAREYLDKPAIHETMVKVRSFAIILHPVSVAKNYKPSVCSCCILWLAQSFDIVNTHEL